jgi:flavin-dependent dehydrogenase
MPADVMERFDVVIAGGGKAGLTLARQLQLRHPGEYAILILERTAAPPDATWKVGESTLAMGAQYLEECVGLRDYLPREHIHKLGVRYYYGGGKPTRLHERPEMGKAEHSHVTEWQFDRGKLERDLRAMVVESGAVLREEVVFKDVALGQDETDHVTTYADRDGRRHTVASRWFIDAMGRVSYLQKKLGLRTPWPAHYSSAWWRMTGRIDLADLVPRQNRRWHERVPADLDRYHSTNHLHGPGYWVWTIPLPSGSTSIGIVAAEDLHPFETFNTWPRALEWLSRHEPQFGDLMASRAPDDFRVMRRYSYSSVQVLSHERWACSGESAVFMDPFYSPGMDAIGFANCNIVAVMELDRQGALSEEACASLNSEFLQWSETATKVIQTCYRTMHSPLVGSAKVLFDLALGAAVTIPLNFKERYMPDYLARRDALLNSPTAFPKFARSFALAEPVGIDLFTQWIERTRESGSFQWLHYFTLPFLRTTIDNHTHLGGDLVGTLENGADIAEATVMAFFLLALRDVAPERLADIPAWFNAWAVSLNPDRWEQDGLFDAWTPPRTEVVQDYYHQLVALYDWASPPAVDWDSGARVAAGA